MAEAAPAIDPETQKLYSALQAADAAGDTKSASALADYIRQRGTTASAAPAAAQAAPQITNPAIRYPAMVGSALLKGTGKVIDTASDIGNALSNIIPTPTPYSGKDKMWIPGVGDLPGAVPQISPAIAATGATDNPRLAPQGPLENMLVGGVEALPYAAADILSGGAAIPATASAVASGLAAEGAHQLAPDSPLAPIAAGFAGGYGAGGAIHLAQSFGKVRQLQAAADAADANFKATRDGMANSRFAVGQTAAQATAASQADFQAAKDLAVAQRQAASDTHDTLAETVAGKLGTSQSYEDAGTQLQNSARTWLSDTLPKKLANLWSPVDKAIPPATQLALPNFRSTLAATSTSAGDLTPLTKGMTPSLIGNMKSSLDALDEDVASGTKAERPFSWGDVSSFRTMLGNALSNPTAVKDYGQQNLIALYAALSKDMKVAANSAGAGNVFDAANQGSTKLFDIAQGPIAKLVKNRVPEPTDPLPAAAALRLVKAGQQDSSDISALRDEIPDAVDHLGAATLRSGGWGKIQSPGTKAALVPNASDRGAVDLSLQNRDLVAQQAKADIASAQANHSANKSMAQAAAASGNLDLTNSMASARNSREAAQAALKAAQGTKSNALAHGVSGLLGATAGPELAIVAMNALGLPGSDIVHGAIGGTLGLLAPPLARGLIGGVKKAVKDPTSMKYPAIGAAVGSSYAPQPSVSNPLTLPTGP